MMVSTVSQPRVGCAYEAVTNAQKANKKDRTVMGVIGTT